MSIVTKTGDHGTTSLMFGRRVPKTNSRVEACGAIDELNAALGMAKALLKQTDAHDALEGIQKQLIPLMGELATALEDLPRYNKEGFCGFSSALVADLERRITEIEAAGVTFKGWALPGGTQGGAALDLARAVCRRSERAVCALAEHKQLSNKDIPIYLNRLSDLLWLMARKADQSG